ncbi:hypothetical protein H0H92_013967 [Tricholoma furcatifolium]|nr:hypothetical protein H0H92_013967 [Tricholoma furcatifolium]
MSLVELSITPDGMFYTRGSSEDFDRYAEVTEDHGWSWTKVQPYIRRNEHFIAPADHHNTSGEYDPSIHGFHGINFISLPGYPQFIDNLVIQTTRDLEEFTYNQDMNSGNLLGWLQATIRGGMRSSSATSYLGPQFVNRQNLHVLINTQVTRVLSATHGKTFATVEFTQSSGSRQTITAKKELILSAGTVGSPFILMNSGIGDKDELEKFNITTFHHLPDVGKNMTDHPRLASNWVVRGHETYDSINQNVSHSDDLLNSWLKTQKGPLVDTFAGQLFFARLSTAELDDEDPASGPDSPHYELGFSNGFVGETPPNGNFMGITTRVVSPTSRGSIKLQSSNPLSSPLIDPGFLQTDFDIMIMREAVKSAMRFLDGPAWGGYILGPYGSLANATSDVLLDSYIRNFTGTSAHCTGTNSMSAEGSTHGVVNPDFRIKGLSGIRVVDASVLPFSCLLSLMSVRPLIAICGTTGVGKSNLAIELALHLRCGARKDGWRGARIINADSMQVYRGMDVITNKVPETEQQGIEHLLMGFKSPGEQYVVGQWVQDALKEIEETHKRHEVPIVVGGTAYWMQHLIFPNRLAVEAGAHESPQPLAPMMSQELSEAISSLHPDLLALFNNLPELPPSALSDPDAAYRLHTVLSILDPPIANRWHWKDTRKVLRSLCIIKETGRRPSEIILQQTQDRSSSKPRFDTLCFWLWAEQTVLEQRLNERVDKMIDQGLLSEIRALHDLAVAASNGSPNEDNTDYTLGIYQSIGYKEFHDYLSTPEASQKIFDSAVERMKLSTRQYAKRQISWIRNKLLPAINTGNIAGEPSVAAYLLDATVLGEKWNGNVRDLGIQLTEGIPTFEAGFLSRQKLPEPVTLSESAKKMMVIAKKPAEQKRICTTCTIHKDRPFMVEEGREWDAHCKTRAHKRLAGGKVMRGEGPTRNQLEPEEKPNNEAKSPQNGSE